MIRFLPFLVGIVLGVNGSLALAEDLTPEAEKVLRGELREEDALRIGRHVMRENALDLVPELRKRVGKN